MQWIKEFFPDSWFTDVTVVRGGRDRSGRWTEGERHTVSQCLVAPRASDERPGFTDLTDSGVVLYRMDHDFEFLSTDLVEVPGGARMAGVYAVAGRPLVWPAGVEVPLRLQAPLGEAS